MTWEDVISSPIANEVIAELKLKCVQTVDIGVSPLNLPFIELDFSKDPHETADMREIYNTKYLEVKVTKRIEVGAGVPPIK